MRTVDYVILYVDDLASSVSFYRDALGLEFRFEEAGYAEFATGAAKFALLERSRLPDLLGAQTGSGRPSGSPGGEVLFLVEDVDGEAARLTSAGVEILSGPIDRPWGHRTLHLLDPEGHVVELAQEIPRQRRRA